MTDLPPLPRDLEVGVATASWQIEGAVGERGRSIWDDFADQPGTIADGSTGEPACDHLHRLEADLDLLAWLGVDAYRFSISWPRVIPDGTGPISSSGLDFYDRLVDGLLARGIAPAATLYHWDLPSPLQEQGGWTLRDTAARFADYAGVVGQRLADRVSRWATLNEPWCSAFLGHGSGVHAPGWRDPEAAFRSAHHLLLAHGWGQEQLRRLGARNVGIVLNLSPAWAEDPASEYAAEHVGDVQNRLWLDSLAGHGVPAGLIARTRAITDWSFVAAGDEAAIVARLDWLGVNYYTVLRVAAGSDGEREDREAAAYPGGGPIRFAPRPPMTEMGWEVAPGGLVEVLQMANQALPGVDLWVSENGAATAETDEGAAIHDPDRIDYLRRHLDAVMAARSAGVPVRGYYVWSLMDNLEWSFGWTKRFGLMRVEEAHLDRRPKDSAWQLRAALARRGEH